MAETREERPARGRAGGPAAGSARGAPQGRRALDGTRELLRPEGRAEGDLKSGSIFFVATATVVLRYGGFTSLTDPNFLHRRDHLGLGHGIRSPRLTDPALDIGQLAPLDLVVLLHWHGDHFDRVAEDNLDRDLPIITTRHGAAYVTAERFRGTYGLGTWEAISLRKGGTRVRLTDMPAKHASGILLSSRPGRASSGPWPRRGRDRARALPEPR